MIITNDLMKADVFRGISAVVFDCDGVLIDSEYANSVYYNLLREHVGLPPMSEAEASYCHCHTSNESIEYIIPADKMAAVLEYQKSFRYADLLPHLRRMDGLFEFLWWLRASGFLLAVNTSRMNTMDMVLDKMDLENFFYPVITSLKVRQPKPHPEGMYQIMNELGLYPEEMVFIGDSIVDQRCAENAGVRFWAYDNQALEADLHITDYWTLRRCMQKAMPNSSALY